MKKLASLLIILFLLPQESNKTSLILVNKSNPLSPNYIPESLVSVPKKYTFKDILIDKECLNAYIKMYEAANMPFIIYSSYRSYEYQKTIFKDETYQAKPGYSEHQTGLAIDVTIHNVGLISEFSNTPQGKWLNDNAHLYGFIIRYPENKTNITGYPYEPWHIRYVGCYHAKKMYANNQTLEEYINEYK